MHDDFEQGLRKHFWDKQQDLPEQPFINSLVILLAEKNSRSRVRRLAFYGLILVAGLLVAPFLLWFSVVVSERLSGVFTMLEQNTSSPYSMFVVYLMALAVLLLNRKVLS